MKVKSWKMMPVSIASYGIACILRLPPWMRGKNCMRYSGCRNNYTARHQAIIFNNALDFILPLVAIGIAGIKLVSSSIEQI